MKIKFLKAKNWLLLALMGLLGFSSCTKMMYDCPPDEYRGYNDSVVDKP